jgi:hypothetical protein
MNVIKHVTNAISQNSPQVEKSIYSILTRAMPKFAGASSSSTTTTLVELRVGFHGGSREEAE